MLPPRRGRAGRLWRTAKPSRRGRGSWLPKRDHGPVATVLPQAAVELPIGQEHAHLLEGVAISRKETAWHQGDRVAVGVDRIVTAHGIPERSVSTGASPGDRLLFLLAEEAQPGRDVGDLRVGLDHCHPPGNEVRLEGVVSVEEDDVLAVPIDGSEVARGRLAPVGLVEHADPVEGGKLAEHPVLRFEAAVVDDDHLEVAVALREQRVDRLAHLLALAEVGHDARHQRFGTGVFIQENRRRQAGEQASVFAQHRLLVGQLEEAGARRPRGAHPLDLGAIPQQAARACGGSLRARSPRRASR